jgi:dinuclear metal center YbgI/SA1388 family protein
VTVALRDLVAYLDGYLRIAEIPDHENAVNGLQVENRGGVARIVACVDAWSETIETIPLRSDLPALLLAHHGLFWDGARPVAGRQYRRLAALLARDMAVYSAHIPLDVHPEVGNNPILARLLGLEDRGAFGLLRGVPLGISGVPPASIRNRDALVRHLESVLGLSPGTARLIPGGPSAVGRVGVITGAGGSLVGAARSGGIDTLVSGEGTHPSYIDAMESGINLIYAGHYATETVGVKALAEHLAVRFGLPWEFVDRPTGM